MVCDNKHSVQDLLDRLADTTLQPDVVLQPEEGTTFVINRDFRDAARNGYARISISLRKNVDWKRGTIVSYSHPRYPLSGKNLAVVSVSNYLPGISDVYFVARLLTSDEVSRILQSKDKPLGDSCR